MRLLKKFFILLRKNAGGAVYFGPQNREGGEKRFSPLPFCWGFFAFSGVKKAIRWFISKWYLIPLKGSLME
jgi:hypothetical protein